MKTLLAGLLALVLVGTAPVIPADHGNVREDVTRVVHQMTDEATKSSCSVVMIAPQEALTARHCMKMEAPVVTIDGVQYPVTFAYGNPALDLALLIIPNAPCPCAKPSVNPIKEGDNVSLVGFPYGIGKVVTYGEFQGRVMIAGVEYAMITAPARPGNSGGGVFNAKGELLGIVSMGDLSGYLTFFVEIDPLLNKVQSGYYTPDEINSEYN